MKKRGKPRKINPEFLEHQLYELKEKMISYTNQQDKHRRLDLEGKANNYTKKFIKVCSSDIEAIANRFDKLITIKKDMIEKGEWNL